MAAHGGKRKGAGRPKGSGDQITKNMKEAIREAFERAGGVEYLVMVANEDHKTFCGLLGKITPKELEIDNKVTVLDNPVDIPDARAKNEEEWLAQAQGKRLN